MLWHLTDLNSACVHPPRKRVLRTWAGNSVSLRLSLLICKVDLIYCRESCREPFKKQVRTAGHRPCLRQGLLLSCLFHVTRISTRTPQSHTYRGPHIPAFLPPLLLPNPLVPSISRESHSDTINALFETPPWSGPPSFLQEARFPQILSHKATERHRDFRNQASFKYMLAQY